MIDTLERVSSPDDTDELRIFLNSTGAYGSFGCGGPGREGTFAVVDSDVSMPGKARQHPQLRAQAEPGQQTTFAVTGTVLR